TYAGGGRARRRPVVARRARRRAGRVHLGALRRGRRDRHRAGPRLPGPLPPQAGHRNEPHRHRADLAVGHRRLRPRQRGGLGGRGARGPRLDRRGDRRHPPPRAAQQPAAAGALRGGDGGHRGTDGPRRGRRRRAPRARPGHGGRPRPARCGLGRAGRSPRRGRRDRHRARPHARPRRPPRAGQGHVAGGDPAHRGDGHDPQPPQPAHRAAAGGDRGPRRGGVGAGRLAAVARARPGDLPGPLRRPHRGGGRPPRPPRVARPPAQRHPLSGGPAAAPRPSMQSTAPLGGEDATVSGMTTRRDEARRQRRAAIVRAALARFADQGYDATTVAEVAEAAGVAPRTVSLHFPTKLDLALAYGTDAARRLAELVAARPAGTSVVDACGTWARRELAEHGEELAGHRAMLAANPGLRGTQTDDGAAARTQVSAAVAAELGRDPGDPSIRFLTGAVDGVLDALLEQPPGPGDDPQAAVDAAVALLRSIVVGGAPRPAPRPVAAVERNQPVPPPAVDAVDGNELGGSTTEPMSAPPVLTERRLLTHLERLEAESIHIIREAVAESERPVMLYSIGKDSGVMLHLARKAFAPAPPPFP